jgi:hypothetical protein
MKLAEIKYNEIYLIGLNKLTGEKYLLQKYEVINYSDLQSEIIEWKKIVTKHSGLTWNDVVIYHIDKKNYNLYYKSIPKLSKKEARNG